MTLTVPTSDLDLTADLSLMEWQQGHQRRSHSTPGTQAAGLGRLQTLLPVSAGSLSARALPAQPQPLANNDLRLGAQHPAQLQGQTGESFAQRVLLAYYFWARGHICVELSSGANNNLGITRSEFHEQGTGFNQAGFFSSPYSQPNVPYTAISPESRDLDRQWQNPSSGNFVANPYASNTTGLRQRLPTTTYESSYDPRPSYEIQNIIPGLSVSPVAERSYELSPALLSPFNAPRANMGGSDDYPSPHSEAERRVSMTNTTPLSVGLTTDSALTPGSESTRAGQISVQRGSPPRNAQGQIYCAHQECANKSEVFRRPCEWK